MKEVWFKFKYICGSVIAYGIGMILGVWFWHLLRRYSYNELIVKFDKMSRFGKKLFEVCLELVVYAKDDADDKTRERIDAGIQNTLGMNTTVDLFIYVKNYNETHSEEAA